MVGMGQIFIQAIIPFEGNHQLWKDVPIHFEGSFLLIVWHLHQTQPETQGDTFQEILN